MDTVKYQTLLRKYERTFERMARQIKKEGKGLATVISEHIGEFKLEEEGNLNIKRLTIIHALADYLKNNKE